MTKEEIIKGSIYGVAVGDALGAPCEFMKPAAVKARFGVHDKMVKTATWKLGEFTDDTWLTLATTRAYENYKTKGLDAPAAGDAMLIWMRTIGKGIGGLTARALGKLSSKQCTVFESGKQAATNAAHGSAGNGSLMRCASTGLIHNCTEINKIIEESTILSEITHADPRCVAACVAYNIILAHIADGKTFEEGMTKALDAIVSINEATHIITADVLKGGAHTFNLDEQNNRGYVLRSYERALIALRDGKDFKNTMIEIVNEGGDADTNGAIAGGLLGAKFGYGSIPNEWVYTLRDKDELDEAITIILNQT